RAVGLPLRYQGQEQAGPAGRAGVGALPIPLHRRLQTLHPRCDGQRQRSFGADVLLEPLMLTPNEAFRKFRSNLELTQKEQDDASRRQKEIRALMDESFKITDDFLTGSYRRWTKTKPLKDIDIFCVFHDDERPKYRNDRRPSIVLIDVEKVLAKEYGSANVSKQRRSVTVDFPDGKDEERVMSFDVIPAF